LHRIANAGLEIFCQARADNDRAGVAAKIVKLPVNELVKNIGGLRMQGRINAVKIDRRVFKSRTSAESSAQDWRARNDIRKFPATRMISLGLLMPSK